MPPTLWWGREGDIVRTQSVVLVGLLGLHVASRLCEFGAKHDEM